MMSKLIFQCDACEKPCQIIIDIDLQGGVAAFYPTSRCVISPHLDQKSKWLLVGS
jgi:hypothetical protein